ncbi:MAG: hypothetical protein EXR72_23800, partial [Myxococcales bacterium]|nr:hypothetical protein [Myxococcales bacterium]
MSVFASRLRPEILLFESAGQTMGVCLVVSASERRGPFLVRRLHLNTAGEHDDDSPCVEFNDLLCRDGFAVPMARALCTWLASREWDEVELSGFSEGPALGALREGFAGLGKVEQTSHESYFVDLAKLRNTKRDFLATLSRNRRYQVRRAIKAYEALGNVVVTRATGLSEALAMLEQMIVLHQRS